MSEPEVKVLHEWEESGRKFRLIDKAIDASPYNLVVERYNAEGCYWWPLEPQHGLPGFAELAATVKALREERAEIEAMLRVAKSRSAPGTASNIIDDVLELMVSAEEEP